MTAPKSDLTGNRTRVYAVRGRRLDRLTIRPFICAYCQKLENDLTGNRTRVYAVRGRRLDRLTIRPFVFLFSCNSQIIITQDYELV